MAASKLDINLLSQAGIGNKNLGKILHWSLTYGRYIIIITQIIVLLAFFSRFKLDQDLSDLHSKIDEKISIVKALSPIETNTRNLQSKLEIIKQLEVSRSLYMKALNTLANQTSTDVNITSLTIDKKQLQLTGDAFSTNGLGSFLTYIRRDGLFNQITLNSVSKSNQDNSLTFSLSMELTDDIKEATKTALINN